MGRGFATKPSWKYLDKMKANLEAPCGFIYNNENDDRVLQNKYRFPFVDCDYDCEHCGFNPKEKARRLATTRTVCITPSGHPVKAIVFARKGAADG